MTEQERESIQEEVVGADKKYRVQPSLEPSTFRTAKARTVRVRVVENVRAKRKRVMIQTIYFWINRCFEKSQITHNVS